MSETQYQENLHFITSHPEAVARHVTAQDEQIATLRAEVEKLRAALEQIIKFADEWEPETQDDYTGLGRVDAAQIARAALGEEKKG